MEFETIIVGMIGIGRVTSAVLREVFRSVELTGDLTTRSPTKIMVMDDDFSSEVARRSGIARPDMVAHV